MRPKVYKVISVVLFGFLYVYTAIGVLIVLIPGIFRVKSVVRVIIQYWAKSVFILMGKRFSVHGKGNIDPDEKYILVANHSSLFDIVAIISFYPGVTWFGHERLLKIPLFGTLLKMTDYVAFTKPSYINTKKMLDELVRKSRHQSVAIFPEGTRTLNGNINEFYKGFIYLFRASGNGILPVTLNGFYQLKPKNRSYINFDSELNVFIHKPIKREQLIAKTDSEIIDTVRNVIESAYL